MISAFLLVVTQNVFLCRRLRAICAERDQVKFINYDHINGEWSFRVAHFTKYGLEDDEDDDSDNDSGVSRIRDC